MYRNQTKWVCRVSNTLHWGRCVWSIEPIWKILIYNLLIVKVTMAHCCVCLIGEVKTDQMAKMQSLWTFEFHFAWIFVKKIVIGVQKNYGLTGMRHITYHIAFQLVFLIHEWINDLETFPITRLATLCQLIMTLAVFHFAAFLYSVFEKSI